MEKVAFVIRCHTVFIHRTIDLIDDLYRWMMIIIDVTDSNSITPKKHWMHNWPYNLIGVPIKCCHNARLTGLETLWHLWEPYACLASRLEIMDSDERMIASKFRPFTRIIVNRYRAYNNSFDITFWRKNSVSYCFTGVVQSIVYNWKLLVWETSPAYFLTHTKNSKM